MALSQLLVAELEVQDVEEWITSPDPQDMRRAVRVSGYIEGLVALLTGGDIDAGKATETSAGEARGDLIDHGVALHVQQFAEQLLAAGFPAKCTVYLVG